MGRLSPGEYTFLAALALISHHHAIAEVLVAVEGQAENEPACGSYRLDARPIGGDPVDLPVSPPRQMSPLASIAIPSG